MLAPLRNKRSLDALVRHTGKARARIRRHHRITGNTLVDIPLPRSSTIKGERNRIQNRRLTRTGISVNHEQVMSLFRIGRIRKIDSPLPSQAIDVF